MKRILTLGIMLCATVMVFAQQDTTGKQSNQPDTIKVGGMIIVRKDGGHNEIYNQKHDHYSGSHRYNASNLTTNWVIFDIGFSNYNDKTNYSSPEAQSFAPSSTKDNFNLKTWQSRNINIWFFMQRLNLVQHVVNLKYGFGLELNNYFFDDQRVHITKNPTLILIDTAYAHLDKNKLAADYLTVPLMLNFNFTPHEERGFGLSVGMSAGFLYSSRQKIKDNGDVSKTHGSFDLDDWKLSYIGELLLGPVKLYGSYATKSMWGKGLDQTPYTVGIRLSY